MANQYMDKAGLSYFWNKIKNYIQGQLVKPKASVVTLSQNGWSSNKQKVYVSGVTSSNSVICSPVPSNLSEAVEAGIYCSEQTTNYLTFTCSVQPSTSIQYNVLIQEVE